MASHFQYKVFLREIVLDGPWGKIMYDVIWIKFKERCDPQVHSFMWIFSTKIFTMEMLTLRLSRKGWISNFRPFEWCKVFRIRKLLKIRTCWKCNKNERSFSYERYFTERPIFEKPHFSFNDGENHEIITRRNILLKQVKII